ncbi:MAG: hypothetical protein JXA54_01200 [Candidatus Heimdallarchaeota archaeon]|nr:hypothetical protein [Candidatus Heimdallarchaeota archaeon]
MLSVIFLNLTMIHPLEAAEDEPFFTLIFKTNNGGVRPDYGNLLRQYLARIGIDVEVIIQGWPTFVGELIAFRDFDICYIGLSGDGSDPDFTGIYNENGSLNMFGYHTSMDWDDELGTGKNEWYMKHGTNIMPPNSEERIQHYWEWEQYLMDKICPLLPTVNLKQYYAYWNELEGYVCSKGILQSWGGMQWVNSHLGQNSVDELVIADSAWSDLNPLYQDDSASSFISRALMDPLFWIDSDTSIWPHLAKNITFINDTTIEIVAREGIKWASDPDGNFTNEYFDIRDVYFTLRSWSYVSSDNYFLNWIKEMEIIDEMTMRIYIDKDDSTPENEPFASCLSRIATFSVLPEYYLNQTQLADGITPDILHPSWDIFATKAFGTGLFQISDFIEGTETTLNVRPDCWWLNTSITFDPVLDWERRFGDFSNYLDQLRIRIIASSTESEGLLKQGMIDLQAISNSPFVIQEYTTNPNFVVQNCSVYSLNFYAFNMREIREHIGDRTASEIDPLMSKGLALRKAICYAIDRNEINEVIHGRLGEIAYWPIYNRMGIWCNPNIIRYNFDLELAKEYMALIGYDLRTTSALGYTTIITLFSLAFITSLIILINKGKKKFY